MFQKSFGFIFLFCLMYSSTFQAQSLAHDRARSLGKGINANQWLSAKKNLVQPNLYTEQDFIQMKALGFENVRLPVGFHKWTDFSTGEINDTLFLYIDQVIQWTSTQDLHLVLDFHPQREDDSLLLSANSPYFIDQVQQIASMWRKVAQRYASVSSDLLLYDIYNEPDFVDKTAYTFFANQVIDSIRSVEPNKTILIDVLLTNLSAIHNSNIIGSFHYYNPGLFTHQGQQWAAQANNTIGIPFPCNANTMPPLHPLDTNNRSLVNQYANYSILGTIAKIKTTISTATQTIKNTLDIPLYCGEFGVSNMAMAEDKLRWIKTVRETLDSLSIPWAMWSWKGINDTASMQLFDCYYCISEDSILKDGEGHTQLCALGLSSNCTNGQGLVITNTIEGINKEVFSIYPNPGTSYLVIQNSSIQKIRYMIYDYSGQLVLQGQNSGTSTAINTQDLASGMYVITFYHNEREVHYQTWVKN